MKAFQIIIVLVLIANQILAQSVPDEKKTYITKKNLGKAPIIDGYLDDIAWQHVDSQEGFVQHEPYNGKSPSQKTFFKITYDDNNIYVAIRCFDSIPEKIVTRLSRRDDAQGDFAGVQIDSYNDKLTAFTFLVTASGVKVDFLVSNDGQNEDKNWDPIWYVETSRDKEGWIAEMRIPLSQLRFSKTEKQKWGLQVARYIHRKQELDVWQYIPKDAPGWVHNFGEIDGITGVKPKRQIEIQPYTVGKTENYKAEEGNPFKTGKNSSASFGMDGKIGITNDFTLDFTVNPDFGQVEADPSEVNLSGFESYFSEKRPFFIEGKNILNFDLVSSNGSGDNLFYSRRIGRSPHLSPDDYDYVDLPQNSTILGAFKLTGKTKNGYSIGILESMTRKEMASTYLNNENKSVIVEPFTNYFVGRLQKDINEGQTRIGGMITAVHRDITDKSLNFLHKAAYTGGIDFNHSWKKRTYYLNAKFLYSYVQGDKEAILRTQTSSVHNFQRPDANYVTLDSSRTSLTGHAGIIQFGKEGNGHWSYTTWIAWHAPGLELNDIGYLRSTDDIFQVFWVGYRFWEPKGIARNLSLNFNQWTGWDFGGNSTYKGGNVNLNMQLKNYWNVGGGFNVDGNKISNFALRGGPSIKLPGSINGWFFISTDDRKKIVFEFNTSTGWAYENERFAQDYGINIYFRPIDVLNFSIGPSYSYYRNNLQYVSTIELTNEKRYILAKLEQKTFALTLRVNYNITPNLSVQYYGQPFISNGEYTTFKKVTNSKANSYNDRFLTFNSNQIYYHSADDVYKVDEKIRGVFDYDFSNPNYKALFFLSNLVIRWEYIPGSTLFFVWSQNRDDFSGNNSFNFGKDFSNLYQIQPHNVFLIKFAYRLKI